MKKEAYVSLAQNLLMAIGAAVLVLVPVAILNPTAKPDVKIWMGKIERLMACESAPELFTIVDHGKPYKVVLADESMSPKLVDAAASQENVIIHGCYGVRNGEDYVYAVKLYTRRH